MLLEQIQKQIIEAMRAKDQVRLSVLRMLASSIKYEQIEKQHELIQEEEMAVIKKEAKKRKDSIEAYTNAGRADLAAQEQQELAILQVYLPPEMTEEELEKLVTEGITESGATTIAEMGKVIGLVMQKARGQADGGRVSTLVKQKLSSS